MNKKLVIPENQTCLTKNYKVTIAKKTHIEYEYTVISIIDYSSVTPNGFVHAILYKVDLPKDVSKIQLNDCMYIQITYVRHHILVYTIISLRFII